ncbi:UNKNOWN [Stylonychia lemnae]|uniref:Uncharacterized protein n=1 Tax=Stylonychia lemnae TaxID=5949 RepID=A0A078B7Z0_STYLE|nr:UNKNOWN [Stylonychia lemnae]|eukprot:CDW89678.1 UNKNOWN [Stylonychia lemnae]
MTPVEDALQYVPIDFDLSEWDNIPSIITKFCLNLNRYMKSTIEFMDQEYQEKVRLQLPQRIENLRVNTEVQFQQHDKELEAIRENIKVIEDQVSNIFQRFMEQDAHHFSLSQETMKKYIKLPEVELKLESPHFEQYAHEENKSFKTEMEKPRMFTMHQIKEMVYLHLNRSTLKNVQNQNSSDIAKQRQMISRLDQAEEDVKRLIAINHREFEENKKTVEQDETEFRAKSHQQYTDLVNKLGLVIKEVKNFTVVVKQGENQIEMMKEKVEKFRVQIMKYQEGLNFRFKETERAFDQSVKKNEDEVMDLQNKIYDQLQEQAIKFDDIVSNNKDLREELTGMLDTLIQDIERKLGRQSNKTDGFSLQVENRFSKLNREVKKVSQNLYKLQIQGPGTIGASQMHNEPQSSEASKKFQAKMFTLESQSKEQELEYKANIKQLKSAFKQLLTSLSQATIVIEQNDIMNLTGKIKGFSPFTSKNSKQINHQNQDSKVSNTLYLPRLKDHLNESSLQVITSQPSQEMDSANNTQTTLTGPNGTAPLHIDSRKNLINAGVHAKTRQNSNEMMTHISIQSDQRPFDVLFYKRLNHIQRILEEDAVEMENVKNYFHKLSKSMNPNSDQSLIIESITKRRDEASSVLKSIAEIRKSHDRSQFKNKSELIVADNSGNNSGQEDKSKLTLNISKKHAESTVKDIKKPVNGQKKHEPISMVEDMIQNAQNLKTISLKNIQDKKYKNVVDDRNKKYKNFSLQPSPRAASKMDNVTLRDENGNNTFLTNMSSRLKSKDEMVDFDSEWKIEEKIQNQREQFHKRLLNHSSNE